MAKYTSGRQKNLKVGIPSYSEDLTSLEVIGKVGIGTTNAFANLQVDGSVILGSNSSDLINIPGRISSNFHPDGDGLYDVGRAPQIGSGANRWKDANFTGKGVFDSGVDAHNIEIGVGAANLIYSASGNLELNAQSGITNIDDIVTITGNTGIGTANPTSKLWVDGDGYFTGILTAQRLYSSLYGEFTGGSISGTNIVGTALSISGISTFSNGPVLISDNLGIGTTNPTSRLWVEGDGYFAGIITASNFYVGNNLVSIGGSFANISVSGITTTNSLNIDATQVISSARQLQNIASLDATTTATIESAIANAPNTFTDLNVTGISTLGVTSATNLTAQQLNVSGVSTISVNSSIAALRITQLGTGNALVVEDSTNPDATPFVIRADGKVGVGTTGLIQYSSGADQTSTFGILAPIGNDSAFVLKGNNGSTTDGSGQTLALVVGSTGGTGSGTNLAHYSHDTSGIGTRRNSIRFTDTQIRFEDNVSGSVDVTINSSGSGELLVGRTSSTGTSNQLLQVQGGAYISNNLGIGTTNATSRLQVQGDVLVSGIITSTDYNSASDINLKKNIKPFENALDKVIQINGVTFEWKKTNLQSAGIIAQDVEKVFPELVRDGDFKTVNYNGLIGVLVESIKELKQEIEDLKTKLDNQ
jgi:hypothetical protein